MPRKRLTPLEAVEIIRRARGVPVIAHPGVGGKDELIPDLIAGGLMGIECYYAEHSAAQREAYLALCRQHDLVATGGSDFHGAQTGRLNQPGTPAALVFVEALRERMRLARRVTVQIFGLNDPRRARPSASSPSAASPCTPSISPSPGVARRAAASEGLPGGGPRERESPRLTLDPRGGRLRPSAFSTGLRWSPFLHAARSLGTQGQRGSRPRRVGLAMRGTPASMTGPADRPAVWAVQRPGRWRARWRPRGPGPRWSPATSPRKRAWGRVMATWPRRR